MLTGQCKRCIIECVFWALGLVDLSTTQWEELAAGGERPRYLPRVYASAKPANEALSVWSAMTPHFLP